jgi:hypothetical protein
VSTSATLHALSHVVQYPSVLTIDRFAKGRTTVAGEHGMSVYVLHTFAVICKYYYANSNSGADITSDVISDTAVKT